MVLLEKVCPRMGLKKKHQWKRLLSYLEKKGLPSSVFLDSYLWRKKRPPLQGVFGVILMKKKRSPLEGVFEIRFLKKKSASSRRCFWIRSFLKKKPPLVFVSGVIFFLIKKTSSRGWFWKTSVLEGEFWKNNWRRKVSQRMFLKSDFWWQKRPSFEWVFFIQSFLEKKVFLPQRLF